MNETLPSPSDLAVTIYTIPLAKTSVVSFESVFRAVDAEATAFFTDLTKARAKFLAHCEAQSMNGAVEAIVGYVPKIVGLTSEADRLRTEFNKVPLKIQWQTPISKAHHYKYLSSTNESRFWIEQIFALLNAGLCYRKMAMAQLLDATDGKNAKAFVEFSVEACKSLHRAAGVFDYIAQTVLPGWSAPLRGFAEMNIQTYEMLSLLCLAESQTLTAKRALIKGQKVSVVKRLWAGAADLWEQTKTSLESIKTNESRLEALYQHCDQSSTRCQSRILWFGGAEQSANGKVGASCAYLKQALKSMNDEKASNVARSVGGPLEEIYVKALQAEKDRLESVTARVINDNDHIYFESEPDVSEFEVVSGAVLCKAIAFEPLEDVAVSIHFNNAMCIIF